MKELYIQNAVDFLFVLLFWNNFIRFSEIDIVRFKDGVIKCKEIKICK
jgi:hypothetical protein